MNARQLVVIDEISEASEEFAVLHHDNPVRNTITQTVCTFSTLEQALGRIPEVGEEFHVPFVQKHITTKRVA